MRAPALVRKSTGLFGKIESTGCGLLRKGIAVGDFPARQAFLQPVTPLFGATVSERIRTHAATRAAK